MDNKNSKSRTFERNMGENHLASNLASNFNRPYEELSNVLKQVITKSCKIVDIGCNDGKIEEYIDLIGILNDVCCVDINYEALKKLKKKEFHFIKVRAINTDANIFLKESKNEKFDLVIINNTLHEINTPENQADYLDNFFKNIKNITKINSTIVLADHYYPEYLSDEEVNHYIQEQYKKIKHASCREEFILPELLKNKIEENGYFIKYSNDIRAVNEIDKHYYIFVIKK